MTDKEIFQKIEECSEESNALYERIHEQVEASIVKHAQVKKMRKKLFTGILSVAVVLIVTLAIVLPITLQSQEEIFRFSNPNALSRETLDCNLKEYCEANNLSLLYLDWYEFAEDIVTARYYETGKEYNTVYFYETVTDVNMGYSVDIRVMKRNVIVENFDVKFEGCQTTNAGDLQIAYAFSRSWSYARFEYRGYKYYLEIDDIVTLDFLVETIESMFNN